MDDQRKSPPSGGARARRGGCDASPGEALTRAQAAREEAMHHHEPPLCLFVRFRFFGWVRGSARPTRAGGGLGRRPIL